VDGERVLPYGGRLAIRPFDGSFVKLRGDLRTSVGVHGEKGLLRIRHD